MDVKDKPKYKETGWQIGALGLTTGVVTAALEVAGVTELGDDMVEAIAASLITLVSGMAYRVARHQQVEKAPAPEEVGEDEDRKGDI